MPDLDDLIAALRLKEQQWEDEAKPNQLAELPPEERAERSYANARYKCALELHDLLRPYEKESPHE
jgi:hypothetical protein